MFNRRKNDLSPEETLRPDIPEWEEVDRSDDSDAVQPHDMYMENEELEPQLYTDTASEHGAGTNMLEYSSAPAAIEIDGGVIEIGDFPALRMARGLGEPVQVHSGEDDESFESEDDSARDRSALIRMYAEMDESEDGEPEKEDTIEQQEEIPELFLMKYSAEQDDKEESDTEEEQTEFTMESELALQREISGELFDYIDAIKLDAETLIRSRARERAAAKHSSKYDPYNLQFNDRYDDTEDILESTPEISMEPKYQMED